MLAFAILGMFVSLWTLWRQVADGLDCLLCLVLSAGTLGMSMAGALEALR